MHRYNVKALYRYNVNVLYLGWLQPPNKAENHKDVAA